MSINAKSKRNAITCENLSKRDEGIFVGYFVIGDPNLPEFLDIVKGSVSAGVDILEIGVPSRNPIYDGDIIRRGHKRVFQTGTNHDLIDIDSWRQLRDVVEVPIWAMGYNGELINTDLYKELADNRLIDGLVLPDCPLEDIERIALETEESGIDVIRFVNSSMSDLQMKDALDKGAFIYAQLYNGLTGDVLARFDNAQDLLKRIRRYSDSVILAGFGIRTARTVRELIDEGFDGVIVASALLARLERFEKDSLFRLISELKFETSRKG